MKNYIFATLVTTVFLVFYAALPGFGAAIGLMTFLFLIGILLLGWMVYITLRFGGYNGKELEEGEEFGYEDMPKDKLWII